MAPPFQMLRVALTQLSLEPQQQRQALAGTVVTDELVLDLDAGVGPLESEMERTGITLDPGMLIALQAGSPIGPARSSA